MCRSQHILSFVLFGFAASGLAQEGQVAPTGDQTAQRTEESLRLANEELKRFEFFLAGDDVRQLTLSDAPLLKHANHNAESYTNLFVWTHQGRPEAIASVTNWYSPRRYYGLAVTSLSTGKLTGTRDAQEIWRPHRPGVEFRAVPEAGQPGDTAVRRLREMRAISRGFSADFKREARYPESGELRLLTTPLLRYENSGDGLIDGAMFGLAFGTAPQLVLLIEARQTATELRWEFAVAPRNSMEYHVRYKDREVWSLPQLAPPWPNSKNPTNTYTVFPDLQNEGRTRELADALGEFERPAGGASVVPR